MSREHQRHACAVAHGDGFTLPGAEQHYPPDLQLEPVHLDIALQLDLEAATAAGTVTHTVEARRAGPRQLTLHAVALEITDVRDVDGRALTWRHDGQELVLLWAEPFAAGEQRRAAIHYRVTNPAGGLYFNRPTAAYPEEPWFAATDHETERARHWLPTVDLPEVRPRLDFHLRAESRFTILANGLLVEETDHGDGTKTAHWRLDWPCPSYLTCFVVADLVKADDGDYQGRPIAHFAAPPFTAEDLHRSFGRTKDMLAWMESKLGVAFPFPKYYQFALPRLGGAMENISLVAWDDQLVLDETLAREMTRTLDAINVHEMAHSYFGDAVVCRDYAHAWLKESWATYTEQLWFEDTLGDDEAQIELWLNQVAYLEEADTAYQRPIVTREFNSSWQMYDRHLYPGGACRLHTLRCLLGDEAFFAAVTDYLATYLGKVVETDDFRRILETHSGRSLVRFFDQWFHTAGYPSLKVTFKHDAEKGEGTFRIQQDQLDKSGEGPLFELETDVGWVLDGVLHTQAVHIDQAVTSVTVRLPGEPEQVRFDPFHKVLHKLDFNPGTTMLRRQLTAAPDVIGRILAGHELAMTGLPRNIEAVRDAYRQEPFWGVRVELARALGNAKVQAAIAALTELVAWEEDPQVLETLIRALGGYRDAAVTTAVSARLDAGLPYRAQMAALEALGKQREQAPFEYLSQVAALPSPYGLAQSGALRGLAASRHSEAAPLLQARVGYGNTSNRARPAAVLALAELARTQDRPARERAAEQLVDLLRDPIPRVRQAALSGLQKLRVGAAIPAVTAYRAPLPVQEQVRVDAVLADLRQGEDAATARVEKELEELRATLRKVEDRVARLAGESEADGRGKGKGKGKKKRKKG